MKDLIHTPRKDAFSAIGQERDYQERKWGGKTNSVPAWILFMEHHLQLARAAVTTQPNDIAALNEIRKVTALGVACMEEHGAPPRVG